MKAKDHIPALIGLVGTTACLILFGRDSFLIPSMIVILVALFILPKLKGQKEGEAQND